MQHSQLLQATAQRYQAAAQQVLSTWQPECGCRHPGSMPRCESCPCLAEFERRVRDTFIHPAPKERDTDR